MLAWMDAEALAATVETGDVHFHSRSRNRLWRKGETSGNVLRLIDLAVDCDGDALLVTADPVGPTCHRGHAFVLRSRRTTRPPSARRRGSGGSKRCGPRSRHAPRSAQRAPTRPACSRVVSMPSVARSPRRPPNCCSPPRTTPPLPTRTDPSGPHRRGGRSPVPRPGPAGGARPAAGRCHRRAPRRATDASGSAAELSLPGDRSRGGACRSGPPATPRRWVPG